MSSTFPTSHLHHLESEAIHILREVASQFERPVLLYSVGKDSSVILRLAEKAFYPAPIPFPLMHIDTGYDFPEMYVFRDQVISSTGAKLIVYRNEEAISDQVNPFDLGTQRCCSLLRTKALVDALQSGEFDAAIGGARREEEKSRAKERIFSHRDKFGQWEPRSQRPELWNLYNARISNGESMRVFPISNWTEIDVWHYIHVENIPVVPLYFAAKRQVVDRKGQLIPIAPGTERMLLPGEDPVEIMCRFRTLGCTPCTGAVRSEATDVPMIISEMLKSRISERATRVIDHDTEGSMEIKKREGYF